MALPKIPTLDKSVISALDFLSRQPAPTLRPQRFQLPLVVGSGNAYNAGMAIFSGQPSIIANESDFRAKISGYGQLIKSKTISQAVIISASGEKDSVWETKLAKQKGLKTTLLTCRPLSSAAKLADEVIAYGKTPEPQTYNVSTYLGMLLSASGEKAKEIKKSLKGLKLPDGFLKYRAFAFVLPDDLAAIAPMIEIKRHELFGPRLSIRAFSAGEARHAKFVIPWDKELVISLGENKYFGLKEHRWQIKRPKGSSLAWAMALTYYLVGRIQSGFPPYFKKNIARYCQVGPKAYGQAKPFDIIVE